ncbi:hypothetical protein BH23CHL8_BH23CHL8_31570 [soil metagenome]
MSTASELDLLLGRLEELMSRVGDLESPLRDEVFALLAGIDLLHRGALGHLADALGPSTVEQLRSTHPAIGWLFEAYAVGMDEVALAQAALAHVRPFIHSHGGEVEVLDVRGGIVSLRMAGSCAGCTSATDTLRDGIEGALREHFPGFAGIEVTEDDTPAHPPPAEPALVQITSRPA